MISVVCVYNNQSIFTDGLLKSLQKQTAADELIALDNLSGRFRSAAKFPRPVRKGMSAASLRSTASRDAPASTNKLPMLQY